MTWASGKDLVTHARAISASHVAFTANSVLNRGRLVMGAGAAKRVRECMPGVDYALGALSPGGDYHLLLAESEFWSPAAVLAVQVKRHYSDPGDIDLTHRSLLALAEFCVGTPGALIVMNCPLVGHGGYADRASEVEEMVEEVLSEHPVVVTTL